MSRHKGIEFIYDKRRDRSVPRYVLCSLLVFTIIFSLLAGIAVGNIVRRQFLTPDAEDTLAICEHDQDLTECHMEWVYSGLVLMEFEVVGQEVPRAKNYGTIIMNNKEQ